MRIWIAGRADIISWLVPPRSFLSRPQLIFQNLLLLNDPIYA